SSPLTPSFYGTPPSCFRRSAVSVSYFFPSIIFFIFFFLLFVWRGLIIARSAPDLFGRLFGTGFMTLVGLQAFTHIGANSGLIPLTGVPLPFISYGGTALAVFLTLSGIVVNISMRK
ncbi:MAG: FtsW/RodA/SpoVE family cell cycle protein, partial [Minisyncoccia bacterium]